ncbi:hypothetical protein WEI85_02740 [Actinomycetes bacterium KLBMP 9797]
MLGIRRPGSAGKPTAFEMLPWVPTFFGVTLMIGLLIFSIVISLRPDSDSTALEPSLLPPVDAPPALVEPTPPTGTTTAPTSAASPSPSPATAPAAPIRPTPTRTSAPAAPEEKPPTSAAPRPDLTGRYRVLDSYGDSFIGEVLVTNSSGSGRDWTVRLRFPSNVTGIRTFWIEGAPQGAMRRSGLDYIFTSGVALGARSSVPLRFQFDRSGRGDTPSACSVNGTPCS